MIPPNVLVFPSKVIPIKNSGLFGGIIYNSENSWNKFGFTCIGYMDLLTNFTHLHLSYYSVKSYEFRHMNFYYQNVLSMEYLWILASKSALHLQYDCKYGTIRDCDVCRTGALDREHCKIDSYTDLHQPINTVLNVNGLVQWSGNAVGASMKSLTLGFWFRRNTNQDDTVFGLLRVMLGANPLYELIVDRDNIAVLIICVSNTDEIISVDY